VADHTTCEPTAGGAPALTGQYEQLRRVALAGHAEGWRHGLGVLATRGMTGWMNACQAVAPPPSPTPAPPTPASGDAFGPDAGELIAVMAAMALAHT
jgi:hypothetical protein